MKAHKIVGFFEFSNALRRLLLVKHQANGMNNKRNRLQ